MFRIIYITILLKLILLAGNNPSELKNKEVESSHIYKIPFSLEEEGELRREIEFLSESYGEGDKKIYILSSDSCKYCKALVRTIKDEMVNSEYHYYVLELRPLTVKNMGYQREVNRIFSELRVIGYPTIYDTSFKQYNIKDIVEYSTFKINLY